MMHRLIALVTCLFVSAFAQDVAPFRAAQERSLGVGRISAPKYSEVIAYLWEDKRVTVEFSRTVPHSKWKMNIRDSWFAIEQSKQRGMKWDATASRCSRDEFLAMINEGLTRFEEAKPGERVESLALDMQVDRDLWKETLTALHDSLHTLRGHDIRIPFYPDTVVSRALRAGEDSPTIRELAVVLRRHGYAFSDIGFGNPPTLRRALAGRSWSEISRFPDAGLELPPVMEIDLR